MKKMILAFVLSVTAFAANPDYPLAGKVLSVQSTHTPNSQYTPGPGGTLGKWSYGASNSEATEIGIGGKIYIADRICKEAQVGSEYPARLEKNKLKLQVGQKVCRYRIEGVRVNGAAQ